MLNVKWNLTLKTTTFNVQHIFQCRKYDVKAATKWSEIKSNVEKCWIRCEIWRWKRPLSTSNIFLNVTRNTMLQRKHFTCPVLGSDGLALLRELGPDLGTRHLLQAHRSAECRWHSCIDHNRSGCYSGYEPAWGTSRTTGTLPSPQLPLIMLPFVR